MLSTTESCQERNSRFWLYGKRFRNGRKGKTQSPDGDLIPYICVVINRPAIKEDDQHVIQEIRSAIPITHSVAKLTNFTAYRHDVGIFGQQFNRLSLNLYRWPAVAEEVCLLHRGESDDGHRRCAGWAACLRLPTA